MKRIIIIAGIILAVAVGMYVSFKTGVHHAMVDSEFWILEFDDASPYDYRVHVLIDGDWYEHGIYVG